MKQVSQSMKDGRIEVLDVPLPTLRPHGVAGPHRVVADQRRDRGCEGRPRSEEPARQGAQSTRPGQTGRRQGAQRRRAAAPTARSRRGWRSEAPSATAPPGLSLQLGELARGSPSATAWPAEAATTRTTPSSSTCPRRLCARVPEGVGLDEAAFATVGAVALQGVRQSGATVGDRVAVIGLGLVGQITVQLLRAAGCEVAGVDLDDRRCAAVVACGAVAATSATSAAAAKELLPATGGVGYDAVIITAGTRSDGPIELAGEIARDRGTVVVVGDVGMNVPRAPYYEKELTLKLSRSYGPGRYDPLYEEMAIDYPIGYVRWTEQRNMAEFMRLVAEGRVDVKALITHRFAVDDAAQAYAVVTDPAQWRRWACCSSTPGRRNRAGADRGRPPGRGQAGPRARVGVSFLGAGNFATATLLPALSADSRFVPRGVYTPSGLSARDVAERKWICVLRRVLGRDPQRPVTECRRDRHPARIARRAGRAGAASRQDASSSRSRSRSPRRSWTRSSRRSARSGRHLTGGLQPPLRAARTQDRGGARAPVVAGQCRSFASTPAPSRDTHWIQRPEEGGGRIIGELCHFVDLAACLAGGPATQVYRGECRSARDPCCSLTTSACLLYFADGSIATIVYAGWRHRVSQGAHRGVLRGQGHGDATTSSGLPLRRAGGRTSLVLSRLTRATPPR